MTHLLEHADVPGLLLGWEERKGTSQGHPHMLMMTLDDGDDDGDDGDDDGDATTMLLICGDDDDPTDDVLDLW